MRRRFAQVDVFTGPSGFGNPLAVVVDADGLTDDQLQEFAGWTNLSETTFVLPPSDADADYRVRIFTPTTELPFAGHPTLGTCAVWLAHGGVPRHADAIVQECELGLVRLRRDGDRLAFAAPPLTRSGPVDGGLRRRIESVLGTDVVDVQWVDNGPGWVAAELEDDAAVLGLHPDFGDGPVFELGVVGPAPADADHQYEVRAFFPGPSGPVEDPVTGSLNASLAVWLMGRDPSLRQYVARQGTVLGRDGRVTVRRDDDGTIWVGGRVTEVVAGTVDLPAST